MLTIKYHINCPTCGAKYYLLDKKCSNCNAKNSNVFYEYLTERKSILDYIKWFFLALFSLPTIVVYIGIFILGAFIIGPTIGILVISWVILPFQLIYYVITEEAHFITNSEMFDMLLNVYIPNPNFNLVSYLNYIGIENIYFTYITLFLGITFVFIALFTIYLVIWWICAKFFEKKVDIDDFDNGLGEIIPTFIYFIPLIHTIHRYQEKKSGQLYEVAQWILKNNILTEDRNDYKEDIKLQIYEQFTHKISKKMNIIFEYVPRMNRLENFVQTLDSTLSDDKIIEKAGNEYIVNSEFIEYISLYKNLKPFQKQIVMALKNKEINYCYSCTLPWTWEHGYCGYFLTKSLVVNLIAYGLAIFLWYIVFFHNNLLI